MALSFNDRAFADMTALEQQLAIVLRRANDTKKVEGMIGVFALIRCARVILNLYPDAVRTMFLNDCIIPFLQNESETLIKIN